MNVLLNKLHAYHHEVAVKITQIKELLGKMRHESDGADDGKLLFKMLEALHGDAERHHHESSLMPSMTSSGNTTIIWKLRRVFSFRWQISGYQTSSGRK